MSTALEFVCGSCDKPKTADSTCWDCMAKAMAQIPDLMKKRSSQSMCPADAEAAWIASSKTERVAQSICTTCGSTGACDHSAPEPQWSKLELINWTCDTCNGHFSSGIKYNRCPKCNDAPYTVKGSPGYKNAKKRLLKKHNVRELGPEDLVPVKRTKKLTAMDRKRIKDDVQGVVSLRTVTELPVEEEDWATESHGGPLCACSRCRSK